MEMKTDILVVGAGMAGLTAAAPGLAVALGL